MGFRALTTSYHCPSSGGYLSFWRWRMRLEVLWLQWGGRGGSTEWGGRGGSTECCALLSACPAGRWSRCVSFGCLHRIFSDKQNSVVYGWLALEKRAYGKNVSLYLLKGERESGGGRRWWRGGLVSFTSTQITLPQPGANMAISKHVRKQSKHYNKMGPLLLRLPRLSLSPSLSTLKLTNQFHQTDNNNSMPCKI